MSAFDSPGVMRMKAAENYLQVSRATLYRLIARGEIRSLKIGSARRIPVAALEAYIAGSKTDGAS